METPGTELRIAAITSVLTGRTLETLADEPGSAGTPYGSRHQQVKPERTLAAGVTVFRFEQEVCCE